MEPGTNCYVSRTGTPGPDYRSFLSLPAKEPRRWSRLRRGSIRGSLLVEDARSKFLEPGRNRFEDPSGILLRLNLTVQLIQRLMQILEIAFAAVAERFGDFEFLACRLNIVGGRQIGIFSSCLLYTSPSPRD